MRHLCPQRGARPKGAASPGCATRTRHTHAPACTAAPHTGNSTNGSSSSHQACPAASCSRRPQRAWRAALGAWRAASSGGGGGASSTATAALSLASGSVDGRSAEEWEQEIEELMRLVRLLPSPVRSALEAHPECLDLLEVVLDLGRPPLARFPAGDVKLAAEPITAADLQYAVQQVGEFGGDNRAGIDRTLHRISCMRNRSGRIVGLTCRVGRAIRGSAVMVRDLVLSGASILLLGRPGVGKTTAIREVSRMLADEATKRVVIVDTSNEIGGDGDIPHAGIGRARRMQVPSPEQQHRIMIEAVENHMPQVIVIDEIGTSEECAAARTIAQRGVQLVATAHGNELENVIKNPQLADLVGGIQSVTLGDDEAKRRGVQKSILERAAPPTFDVCIEMLERTKWRVHLDVGQAVDVVLAGNDAGGQVRERAADGTILKYNYNPAISGVIRGAARTPGGGGGGGGSGPASSSSSSGGYNGGNGYGSERGSGSERASGGERAYGGGREGGGGGAAAREAGGREADFAAAAPSGNSFVRNPLASYTLEDADAAAAAAAEGDFGAGKRLRRVLSRQAVAGVTAEGAALRLYVYELDEDVLWEVMSDMRLTGKVHITPSLAAADAVLALRSKVKHNAELRAMAREGGVPIYAVKTSGSSNLVKAFRTLLGIDPAAGGAFDAAAAAAAAAAGDGSAGPLASASGMGLGLGSMASDDEGDVGSSPLPGGGGAAANGGASEGGKAHGYKAWAEGEAIEEAQLAVTDIVLPLQQPVELMPRAASVIEAQVALLQRYGLPYERVGSGAETRLRILPKGAGAAAGGAAAAAAGAEVVVQAAAGGGGSGGSGGSAAGGGP